jgi:hypothetical protein
MVNNRKKGLRVRENQPEVQKCVTNSAFKYLCFPCGQSDIMNSLTALVLLDNLGDYIDFPQ